MSTAVVPTREAVFQTVLSQLRDKAPLLHNMWAALGRGHVRDIDELARVLYYPATPPDKRQARQQRVGAFIAHLNKRIADRGVVIRPGAVKGTYQLYDLHIWKAQQEAARQALLAVPEPVKRRAQKNRA